jgi:hypothetical protein
MVSAHVMTPTEWVDTQVGTVELSRIRTQTESYALTLLNGETWFDEVTVLSITHDDPSKRVAGLHLAGHYPYALFRRSTSLHSWDVNDSRPGMAEHARLVWPLGTDPDAQVRMVWVRGLPGTAVVRMSTEERVALLTDPDDRVRRSAYVSGLHQRGGMDDESLPSAYDDSSALVRSWAAQYSDRSYDPRLAALFDDPAPEVRVALMKNRSLLPALIPRGLADEDPKVRLTCLQRRTLTVEQLETVLNDPDERVRALANTQWLAALSH